MIASSLPDLHDGAYTCVRFIDPYGDTIFNPLQAAVMLEEWDRLRPSFSERNADPLWADIRKLIVRCSEEPHTYLKFIGDSHNASASRNNAESVVEVLDSAKQPKEIMDKTVHPERNSPVLTTNDLLPNAEARIGSDGKPTLNLELTELDRGSNDDKAGGAPPNRSTSQFA